MTNKERDQRVAALVRGQIGLVWRTLRRLAVPAMDLEDATQKVFMITAQKLDRIAPDRERSFVFGTALRVASAVRRSRRLRREDPGDALAFLADPLQDPEGSAGQRQALEMVATILDRMPEDVRRTFLLFELEEWTMAEIAALDRVPPGTVASRLRRARDRFRQEVTRLEDSGWRTGT